MPPASMLSEGQAAAAKNVVYFSNPQPLDIHGCPTLKQGGSGGACTKSLPYDVSLPFAPLDLRRCLFFQHRTLILRVKGLSSALRGSAHWTRIRRVQGLSLVLCSSATKLFAL